MMASAKHQSSTESGDEEEKITGSDPLVQVEDDDSKSAKLSLMCETTLHDLPIETLECILVNAVAFEVMGMKLSRSVWNEKADLVISRLSSVCSQWSSILATDFYRKELQKLLDSCGDKTIRLEILYKSRMRFDICGITTMKDEVFMYCCRNKRRPVIKVFDRNNLKVVSDVIQLPGRRVHGIAACKLSNCVYVGLVGLRNEDCDCKSDCHCFSVLRITRDEDQNFNVLPWIRNVTMPYAPISVTTDGSVMFLTQRGRQDLDFVSLYDTNGCLQHEIMLTMDIDEFGYAVDVIQKPNGNLLLAYYFGRCILVEIDMSGNIVRQSPSVNYGECRLNYADAHGRIIGTGFYPFDGMEMFDAELNPLHFSNPLLTRGIPSPIGFFLHYNSERNEVMCMVDKDMYSGRGRLTIFRFTEE